MSTGSLLYPAGYTFLDDNGAPLNAGLLYSYRTGTTTAQNLYSDSTLSTALTNPVVLSSAGRATTNGTTLTAIYGASDTGFDYRLTLKTSAASQVWQLDDIIVDGADTATYSEGSFTGTLTGMSGATTGTITFRITANAAGTGKRCVLSAAASILGTSTSTALTMTGLPATCQPAVAAFVPCTVRDNSVDVLGAAEIIVAAPSVITFYCDPTLASTGFTAANNKGVVAGWQIEFNL